MLRPPIHLPRATGSPSCAAVVMSTAAYTFCGVQVMARNGARIKDPRKDSIAYQAAAFLFANPDEELDRSDVARKFGIDPTTVDL